MGKVVRPRVGPRVALVAALVAVAAGGAVRIGLADSLNLGSESLGASGVSAPRCTTGALTILPVLSGSNVASITVATLPSACGGATLQASVNNGSASATGSATVPAGGGSVTVPISGRPALTVAIQTDIVLVGP
jgi:hypothetical protein